jgi:hypothetical protein
LDKTFLTLVEISFPELTEFGIGPNNLEMRAQFIGESVEQLARGDAVWKFFENCPDLSFAVDEDSSERVGVSAQPKRDREIPDPGCVL